MSYVILLELLQRLKQMKTCWWLTCAYSHSHIVSAHSSASIYLFITICYYYHYYCHLILHRFVRTSLPWSNSNNQNISKHTHYLQSLNNHQMKRATRQKKQNEKAAKTYISFSVYRSITHRLIVLPIPHKTVHFNSFYYCFSILFAFFFIFSCS